MKILIVGANGKAGIQLVNEATSRGYHVVAVVRNDNNRNKVDRRASIIVKDILELTSDDVKDADAVLDAFGAWTAETLPGHTTTLMHLADILKGSSARLLVVGGAGSLFVDPDKKTRVMELPTFPEDWKPLASAMGQAFEKLKELTDVDWTYISPSANFDATGKRTGSYKTGTDFLLTNAEGESVISYADFALAMMDEVENRNFINQRITVCSV